MIRGLVLILLAVVVVGAVILVIQFRRDMATARSRLAAEAPELAQTACGPIEYVSRGEGPAVVVLHGIFGGFDQGLVLAGGHIPAGYRVVSPSRFGYLGTPMPDAATPETQADAIACLLDHLGIGRAVLFGTSAGATAALQLALRHRDRVAGLILMSANAPGEVDMKPPPRAVSGMLFRSDFLFWLATTYFQSALRPMMGVPEGFALTAAQEAAVSEVMTTILPVGGRSDGALFDMYVSNPHINTGYALETLRTPVLVINARDDPMTLYRNAEALAGRIEGARLVTLPDGGHMLLGHQARVRDEIADFLARSARP